MLRPSFLRVGQTLATVLGLVTVSGCSLILHEDAKQCSTDADCTSRSGAQFQYSKCDLTRNVCVSSISTDAGDAGDGGNVQCKTNEDCLVNGQPAALCISQKCVQLAENSVCPETYYGPTTNTVLQYPDAYGIGIVGLGYGATNDDLLGAALGNAEHLAYEDFRTDVATFNPSSAAHVFVVRCDEASLTAALKHLQDLGVNLIVGPQLSDDALQLLGGGEASFSFTYFMPVADDPRLEAGTLSDELSLGNVWGMRPNRNRELNFLTPMLEAAGQFLAQKLPTQFSTLHVAYVLGSDAASQALQGLTLPPNSVTVQYTDASSLAQKLTTEPTLPNLIVASSDVDPWTQIIPTIENAWPNSTKPWYVLRGRPSGIEALDPTLPRRILRIALARSQNAQSAYNTFAAHYTTVYGSDPTPEAEYGYDAMSMALITSFLWHATPSHDPDIGKFAKLVELPIFTGPGADVDMVPFATSVAKSQIAVATTAGGKTLNLYGASGDLNFDATQLTPSESAMFYCSDSTTSQLTFCDLGLRFSPVDGSMSGTVNAQCHCP